MSRRYFQIERAQIDKDVRNVILMGSEDTDLRMGSPSMGLMSQARGRVHVSGYRLDV